MFKTFKRSNYIKLGTVENIVESKFESTMVKGPVIETQASETASDKLPTCKANSSKGQLMDKSMNEIKKAQKPKDLLVHLFSPELTNEDKEDLLHYAPRHLYTRRENNQEDFEEIEAQLTEAGYARLALSLYWCVFWDRPQPEGPESWIKELIEIDIERRWIAQRKVCIQEKVQNLQISSELLLSSEDEAKHASQLKIYKDQLTDLNKRQWALSRKKWTKEGSIDSWSFGRAYHIQRKNPDWYLSDPLVADCAGRGGCCGKGCGCCERPRTVDGLEDGTNTRGHCTTACSCCLKARGIEELDGDNGEIIDLQELYFEYKSPGLMDPHSFELLKGYVFAFGSK
ncbi:uncharacterized protein PGRI_042170 [Penicillium griseofulvum]|uniref:Uncharacterized protein n=1 Tax=Penicillium patulum TaxID=5078 RepID=A0A135L8L8_PENPA|nr:uncharacterized protein PGRI_042170 [Penicillium griseofulvum]KXG45304.1 hypothetical protein PGRI_042170 [Penicillium griseofulvum]